MLPSLKVTSETNHLRLVAFKKRDKLHPHWSWAFSLSLIPLFTLRKDHFLLSHVFKQNKNMAKQEDYFVLFENQENSKSRLGFVDGNMWIENGFTLQQPSSGTKRDLRGQC